MAREQEMLLIVLFLILELDVVMNCVVIAFNRKQSPEDETTLTLSCQ